MNADQDRSPAQRFDAAMRGIHAEARELGYNATRFIQMIERHGGVDAAKRLLATKMPQQGFATLWELGRPDISVEYLILKPEFRTLFAPTEKLEARKRLEEIGFKPPS